MKKKPKKQARHKKSHSNKQTTAAHKAIELMNRKDHGPTVNRNAVRIVNRLEAQKRELMTSIIAVHEEPGKSLVYAGARYIDEAAFKKHQEFMKGLLVARDEILATYGAIPNQAEPGAKIMVSEKELIGKLREWGGVYDQKNQTFMDGMVAEKQIIPTILKVDQMPNFRVHENGEIHSVIDAAKDDDAKQLLAWMVEKGLHNGKR